MKKIDIEIKRILKKVKKQVIAKFIISIIYRGLLLIIPIFWSRSINYISRANYSLGYKMIIIALVLSIFYYLAEYINQIIYYKLYNKLYKEYTKSAIKSLNNNSIYSLSRFNLGEFTNILNNDIDIMSDFFGSGVIRVVQIMEFLVIYIYFLSLNIYIFLITVIISILMIIIMLISGEKTHTYNLNRKETLDYKTYKEHEIFNGIKEIKGFNIFNILSEKFYNDNNKYLKANRDYNIFYKGIKYFVMGTIELCRYSLILYGVYLVSKGHLELGAIVGIYTYYGKIVDNFDIISTIITEFRNFEVSSLRFNKLLEYSKENKESKLIDHDYSGDIIFEDVLYGNREDPILNHINLELKENQINIITGNPSTGKTGIFDLLLKINEKHSGSIYIGNNPIESIPTSNYFNLIAAVRKNPFFFNCSIKDNLTIINDDFEKIQEICKVLKIHEYIVSLDDGYDTNIIDANIPVSIKTLIALARVIIKNPKIMLIDESFSNLEDDRQETILKLLKNLKEDHTIILISREKHIIDMADNLIIMDNNRAEQVISNV